jgi:hypothetical protein
LDVLDPEEPDLLREEDFRDPLEDVDFGDDERLLPAEVRVPPVERPELDFERDDDDGFEELFDELFELDRLDDEPPDDDRFEGDELSPESSESSELESDAGEPSTASSPRPPSLETLPRHAPDASPRNSM